MSLSTAPQEQPCSCQTEPSRHSLARCSQTDELWFLLKSAQDIVLFLVEYFAMETTAIKKKKSVKQAKLLQFVKYRSVLISQLPSNAKLIYLFEIVISAQSREQYLCISAQMSTDVYIWKKIYIRKRHYISEWVSDYARDTRFWDRMKELHVANVIALCNADRRHSDMTETDL